MDNTTDIETKSWIDLMEVASVLGNETLQRHSIDTVLPVLLDRNGDAKIVTEHSGTAVQHLIRYLIAGTDTNEQFGYETRHAADQTTVSFEASKLVSWIQVNGLPIPTQWKCYCVAPNKEKASPHPDTMTFEQLQTITGKRTATEIKAWLASKEISFYTGSWGRPFTTVAALNRSLGVVHTASNDDDHAPARPKRNYQA